VWLITRGQTKRIRQLKAQAEKFRDADFGDPLPETGGDELGALASVFNDMRDRLRTTTHSRDYVDSILSGMNEAIIVTSDDGQIRKINLWPMTLRQGCRAKRCSKANMASPFRFPIPARLWKATAATRVTGFMLPRTLRNGGVPRSVSATWLALMR
jgi:HAMP domain-containing protein